MSVMTAVVRAVVALFLDDGLLASAILGIVCLAALLVQLVPDGPLAGAVLLLGLLAALVLNVLRAARR
jgi:hypothetical protein